ncbi:PAS domain-containing protein [Sporomusa termitida]|uniref:PAS fold protein n=1 Tax=Sporomusa termitida TaxID=2377 RepID=A0A517DNQ0_9FIRM|nr:PAS domain-containing protein [Sporomusa termitida]QDR78993.1 PAS fold protein [Sporomusa termitida]
MPDNRAEYNGDNMPVLVTRWDCNGYILNILYNDLCLGRPPNQFLGKNFRELGLEKKIYEKCEHYFKRVVATAAKVVFQLRSSTRYYHISYLPESNCPGDVATILGIVRDMTQEQWAKDEMNLAHRKFSTALNIAKLGYFEWDFVNNELHWSDQQYKNFGYMPQSFIPTMEFYLSLVYPEDLEIVNMTNEVARQGFVESEFRIIRPDRTVGWLWARVESIANEQGAFTSLFGTTQDITEQKQTENRILRVAKDLVFSNQLNTRSAYLNRLLVNAYSPEYITKALNEFGIETKAEHCCFVMQLTHKPAGAAEPPAAAATAKMAGKQAVLVWVAEKEIGCTWKFNDDIILLVMVAAAGLTSKQRQIDFANQLISEMKVLFPHISAKIGISGTSGTPIRFRDSYEKANRAVIVAASNCAQVVHCDDIGIYEVAFQLLHDENTCALVQNTIGRLAEYDQVRGSNLLFTLELILEEINLKAVSQKLFIHHNTVIWRKRRIEDFLGMSLDKMETKVLLILYLKIWKLQKAETGENR